MLNLIQHLSIKVFFIARAAPLHLPSFLLIVKETKQRKARPNTTVSIFLPCLRLKQNAFDARNSGQSPLKQDGLVFGTQGEILRNLRNGHTKVFRDTPLICHFVVFDETGINVITHCLRG